MTQRYCRQFWHLCMLPDSADIHRVDHVQASSSDAGTRCDASLDDEVVLQLEFERRFFLLCACGDVV